MKNFLLIIVFLSVLLSCNQSEKNNKSKLEHQKQLQYVFDLDKLATITLEVSLDQWNQMLSNIDANPRTEEVVAADFTWEREGESMTLTNIALRTRGNVFSRGRPEGKKGEMHNPLETQWDLCHYKVRFDKFQDSQDFFGLKGLNLKYFNNDSTYVREVYSYDLFRRFGVYTGSHITYTRLYLQIKGETKKTYFGIYSMIEPIDTRFVSARFDGETGYLWKCLYGADFKRTAIKGKMGIEDVNPTNSKASHHPPYDLKTSKQEFEQAKAVLYDFVQKLNTLKGKDFERWVDKHVDVDQFMRYLAVNTMLGMWDDYWNNQNNFYVYFNRQGKMTFIPYDYDNTLGTGSIVPNIGTQDVLDWSPNHKNRPLVKKVLDIPKYEKLYRHYIAELVDPKNDYFALTPSTNRIIKWQNMVSPYISNDVGQNMVLADRPARWGNTPYYRLLSGDHFGGPLPANYFSTRAFWAEVQLGMRPKPVEAKVSMELTGMTKHKKGYYFTTKSNTPVSLELKSPQKISRVICVFRDNLNITNQKPESKVDFELSMGDPREYDSVKADNLVVIAENDKGEQKRQMFKVFLFDDSYISPQIMGDQVTFRMKYEPGAVVEMRGPFNQWGDSGKIFLQYKGNNTYELNTNKTFVNSGTEYYFRAQKDDKNRWITDYANTNNMNQAYHAPIYIYK